MQHITSKLSLENLKLGMQVRASQLENIYNTAIILVDAVSLEDGDVSGTVAFFGDNVPVPEAEKIFSPGASICPVFHEKAYLDGDITYEE